MYILKLHSDVTFGYKMSFSYLSEQRLACDINTVVGPTILRTHSAYQTPFSIAV